MAIVLLGGWFLLPDGYNDLIAIFAPQFGNFMRPTVVMVNLILVNPMSNFTMIAIWAGAGFVGGVMAGTKKGAFVVGLMVWLSCFGLIALFVYLLFTGGIALGSFIVPPGSSIVDILGIPIIQGMIDQILPLLSGLGGFDLSSILTLITPLLMWFFTPVIVVIVAAIVGAVVRPKEEF